MNYPTIKNIEEVTALFPRTPEEIKERNQKVQEKARKGVEKIINLPESERNFTNTFKALDTLGSWLSKEGAVFQTVLLLNPDEKMREAAQAAIESLECFALEELSYNEELYKILKAYDPKRDNLTPEEEYYRTEYLKSLVKSGLELPEKERKEVMELMKELVQVGQQFEVAIAQDTSTVTVKKEELSGLPESFINELEKTPDGLYILPTNAPTREQVLNNSTNEETRKKFWLAYNNRAYPKNIENLDKLIALRDKVARALGFKSYAHYNIDQEMAESPEKVQDFLESIAKHAVPKAVKEMDKYRKELIESVTLTEDGKFKPWDGAFMETQYKKKHYNIDPDNVAEYFPLENTLEQLLKIYEEFLGVKFNQLPVKEGQFWHPDIKLIEVHSSDNKTLGYLLLDLFPRPHKYSHFAHLGVVHALTLKDGTKLPAVSIVMGNFTKPTSGKPALLKHETEVITFFHEFGHALHFLLGATELASTAGTNVKTDFVEMPSQMLERWMWEPSIIKRVSAHYKTGESLPDELIKTMIELKNYDIGDFYTRQILLARLALAYFAPGEKKDTNALFHGLTKEMKPHLVDVPENHFQAAFGHLNGYGAKYYGYLWSEVFADDLFSYIKEHGLLSPEVGKRYVDKVLSKGGSQPPQDLVRDFLGREMSNKAFFKDKGF